MDGGSWHCMGDRNQDHPQEKEMQKSKMVVWGDLTNSYEKKRSKKQRRKGKICSFDTLRTSSNERKCWWEVPWPPALWWDSSEERSLRTSRVCSGTAPLLARVVTVTSTRLWSLLTYLSSLLLDHEEELSLMGSPPDQLHAPKSLCQSLIQSSPIVVI